MIVNHHDPIDLNFELKINGKYIQNIAQVHTNVIIKQMAIKFGELLRQFNFRIRVFGNVRYENHPEDAPIEVTNHQISVEITKNLTKKNKMIWLL